MGSQIFPAKSGETARLRVILQNALDSEVEGKVRVDVPQRVGLMSKTHLSTIPAVDFRLEGAEVRSIGIPIKTTMETPEGEYEITLEVSGKELASGKRVRGKKKAVGTDLGKSAALSVGLSAVLLPILGGVAIQTVSSDFKGKLKISGRSERVDNFPLEKQEQTLFGTDDVRCYEIAYSWLEKSSEILRKPGTWMLLSETVRQWIMDLFQEKHTKLCNEEIEWMSRYVAYQSFSVIPLLTTTIAFEVGIKMKQGMLTPQDLRSDVTTIFDSAIKPWAGRVSKDQKLLFLALSAATAWHVIQKRMSKKEVNIVEIGKQISHTWQEGQKGSELEGSPEWAMQRIQWPLIFDGVRVSPTLFPEKKERVEHLNSILKVFKAYVPEKEGIPIEGLETKRGQYALGPTIKLIEWAIAEEKK